MEIFFITVGFLMVSFVFSVLFMVGFGRLLKIKDLTIKRGLVASVVALLIGLGCQALLYGLQRFELNQVAVEVLMPILSWCAGLWALKRILGTSYKKVVALQVMTLVSSLILALPIRTYAVKAYTIPSASMVPTLLPGDHILVNQMAYRFSEPERGDVIVCEYPENPKKDFLERIVAMGGDEVEIRNKKLFLNGQEVWEAYAIHIDSRMFSREVTLRDNFGPMRVPEGSCFVMGDNRDNSHDSRFWGVLSLEALRGKVVGVYWSVGRKRNVRWDRIGNIR